MQRVVVINESEKEKDKQNIRKNWKMVDVCMQS